MTQIQFYDWTFLIDKTLTTDIYLSVNESGADKCDCSFCKNYIARRPKLFDTQLLSFFNDLGIDSTKEYEVCYLNRESNGLHLYTTWFDFVGQILDEPDLRVQLPNGKFTKESYSINSNLSISFAETSKPANSFFNEIDKIVQMTFILTIPWTVSDEEPQ